ncbi:translocation and assembly module TamA [Parvibaculum indicum]|uniref:autotransporter assembly complex protein TamA n=1 Tax=Parvibaculum indicum TaxID=562969 RepID=UPI001421332C|nr:autotransporter assembly complex family protein [Parvibaculum indicum]NIJ40874.1 translocation and assembly module TamA [Parvibaculum indicum]
MIRKARWQPGGGRAAWQKGRLRALSGISAAALAVALTSAFAAPATEEEADPGHIESPPASPQPEEEAAATADERSLDFSTEVRGPRIPDYLQKLMEDAVQTGKTGTPVPTLAQLRRRAAEDEKRIDRVLRSEAYYSGRISSSIRQETGGAYKVVFDVDLGERTMIESFDIVYADHPEDESELPPDGAFFGLKPERAAKAQRIIDLTNETITWLNNHGHPDAELADRKVIVDLAAHTATVTLSIKAGEPMLFGLLAISNEGRVRDDYVRSFITFEEGKAYDRSEVDKSLNALRKTGLFDQVALDSGQTVDGNELPQDLTLKESDARTVRLGANYTTSTGPGAKASWEHRNLLGRGEKLTLGLNISQTEQSATADFNKPRFLRQDQTLTANFEIAHERSDAYNENRIKSGVGLVRPLTDNIKASLGVTFELVRTADSRGNNRYQLVGIPAALSYDGSNNLLDPTEGIRATVRATPYFGRANQKATAFTRLEGIGSTYFSFGKRDDGAPWVTLAARGRAGSLLASETDDVPGSTRFYAGGGGSVRGYGYQLLGPLDSDNDPVGGRSVLEANFEARLRVTESIGTVAFLDGGNAYSGLTPSFGKPLKWGAGLGFRYYTPVGPVRFDVAVPLDRRDGVDDRFQIYVSLGQAF